jgi:hypothetical protein
MPARPWSAFLARDERGLIGARDDRPDKKNERRAAAPGVAARSRTSWPGGSPQRLDLAPNDLALVARRAAAVCVPLLAGARSFAICPIQILSASTATAARQATSTTSATASYSSQRKLFANITFFRRRVCVKLPEKEARSPYI